MSKDVVAFCMQISIKRSKPSAEKIDILTRPSRDHLPRKGKTEHNQLLTLRAKECERHKVDKKVTSLVRKGTGWIKEHK